MAMSASGRTSWISGASVTVLGAVFLAAWSLVLVRLGPAGARSYLVLRGLVALGAAVIPISSVRWIQAHPAVAPGFAKRVAIGLELSIAAAMTIALVATSSWWARRAGIEAPAPWLIAACSLHHGAARLDRAVIKLGVEPAGALVASLAMLAQLAATPLAALLHGSIGFVIGASSVASMALAAVALRLPPRVGGEVSLPRPLVHLPSWLGEISHALPRIVVALAVAGAMVVPYESAALLVWIVFLPFMLGALPQVTGLAPRLARGILLATMCYGAIATFGPGLYRAVFPGWFGGASLMRCFAWSAVALVPLSYYKKRKGEPDWRTAVTALASIVATIVLVPVRGVVGVVNAQVIKLMVASILGIADPTRREESLLG